MKPFLVLFIILLACSKRAAPERGPEFTAIVANQLRALADVCELKREQVEGEAREIRTCRGPTAKVRIQLGPQRHIRVIEMWLGEPSAWDARKVVEARLPGLVSPAVIEAITARLQATPTSLGGATVDGVTLAVTNEVNRYAITLTW